MELIACIPANDAGMTDLGSLRVSSAWFDWVPVDGGEYQLVVLLRDPDPTFTLDLRFSGPPGSKSVQLPVDVGPAAPGHNAFVTFGGVRFGDTPGIVRIEVRIVEHPDLGSVWCEVEVR